MKRVLPVLAASLLLLTSAPAAFAAAGLSSVQSDEIQMSYDLLTSEFYKRVDPQVPLDGARREMIAYLHHRGIAEPAVPDLRAGSDTTADARALEDAVATVAKKYGDKVSSRDLTYSAISGVLDSVHDKYTVFLDPKEYAQLNEGLDGGNFSGVGLVIQVDDKTKLLEVAEVIAGGPADRAGVQAGDAITAVDGVSTKGLTSDTDAKMLRGPQNSHVTLAIERNGVAIAPIVITREVIHAPSVFSKMLDGNIGYARLSVFGLDTGSELSKALHDLDGQGAKAIILDLRDNGGGYLNTAVDVSSEFIPSGPIVSVESRGGNDTEYDAENVAIPPKPLAVLVNGYTASASEITSGALQDDGVGKLIGTKTYGKGVVQTIHQLPDGSAVKITTARYLTPRGRDINLIGIEPDIVTSEPKTARLGDPGDDPQLQAAITYLQGKLAEANASS
ncbi:MAG: S41 family peptidase [Vulcanimicrobiaceae bacterium]